MVRKPLDPELSQAQIDAIFSPPRCAVCGGPNADGSGCEFCPIIEAPDVWHEVTHDGLAYEVNAPTLESAREMFRIWLAFPFETDWVRRAYSTTTKGA